MRRINFSEIQMDHLIPHQRSKIAMEDEGDADALGTIPKGLVRRRGINGNRKTSRDNPSYNFVKIYQNTVKIPGDLRWLAIIQTPMMEHRLTLVWKTNNNNNKVRRRRRRTYHPILVRVQIEFNLTTRKEYIVKSILPFQVTTDRKWKKTSSSSSSCRTASTDIPNPLLPLLPIIHRLWQVFRATSYILTELLCVCPSWPSCFCSAICRGP